MVLFSLLLRLREVHMVLIRDLLKAARESIDQAVKSNHFALKLRDLLCRMSGRVLLVLEYFTGLGQAAVLRVSRRRGSLDFTPRSLMLQNLCVRPGPPPVLKSAENTSEAQSGGSTECWFSMVVVFRGG